MIVDAYRETAADLHVVPELIATNDLFTQHKNMLEHCRHWHNGEPVDERALNLTLDRLDEIVQALRELARSRYA